MPRLKSNPKWIWVDELENKFRELRLKDSSQQKIIRQLSRCIQEKFDGINIICVEYNKKFRKKFKPINVIYKTVRKPKKIFLCYSTTDISKAYIEVPVVKEKKTEKKVHGFAYECYYCRKFFAQPDKHKRHIEICAGIPCI